MGSPRVFRVIQQLGKISDAEMYRVFNMGIGMAVVVAQEQVDKVIALCSESGISAFVAGEIVGQPAR